MQAPKTVSALKRALTVGTRIEMTKYCNQEPSERIRGIGTITRVQTNGVYIDRGNGESYVDFPSASNYNPSIEYNDRFEFSSGGVNPITLEYRIIT